MHRFAAFLFALAALVGGSQLLDSGASTEASGDTGTVPLPTRSRSMPAIDQPAVVSGGLRVAVRLGLSGADETQFVRRGDSGLTVAGRPWSFVGMNIYNANSRSTCWYPMFGSDLSKALQATSASVMRAWFFQPELLIGDDGWDWSAFDETLAAAKAADVRVIATLTDQWGACEPGGRKTIEWYRAGYRTDRPGQPRHPDVPMPATYRDYVAAIVARYRDDPTVMGWQLVNEPDTAAADGSCGPEAPAVLQAFTADMATLVRSIDSHHLVSMGTIGSGQCGTSGEEYTQLQQAGGLDWCELHDYYGSATFGGDERNGMATRVAQCAALGVPVIVGESGIDAAGDVEGRAVAFAAKIDQARQRGVDGYVLWSWADPPAAMGGADQFAIGPDDPVLDVLAEQAPSWNS